MSEKIIVIDTETTGLDTEKDHVIDICIRRFEDDATPLLWRVKPPVTITEELIKIHGITNEMVADSPNFGMVADDIAQEIEWADIILGWNPEYDVNMLKREFKLAHRPVNWPKYIICGKRIWDIYEPKKRSLTHAFQRFVDPAGFEGAHGAVADVNATARVLKAQVRAFGLEGKSWKEIDPERAKWVGPSEHLVWKDSYQQSVIVNFGKHRGKDFAEIDGGYIHYLIEKDFPKHIKALCAQLKIIKEQKIPNASLAVALWAKENL